VSRPERPEFSRNHTAHDHLVQFNLGVIFCNQGDYAGARCSRRAQLPAAALQPRSRLRTTGQARGRPAALLARVLASDPPTVLLSFATSAIALD
jgi:hypothetical protein